MSARILLTASLLISSATGMAGAQECAVGIKPPAAGSWAEYSMSKGTMRLALLGTESKGGKEFIRLEMAMRGDRGPMIMQLLVPGYPYEMNGIEDMVMKMGNQPAMRMSSQMLSMMRGQMPQDQVAMACRNSKMTRVGEESITVPAGTFRTIHYRDETSGGDVWVSESVPFGMVKAKPSSGEEVVLTGRGSDAKSQITETPQEMRMPN